MSASLASGWGTLAAASASPSCSKLKPSGAAAQSLIPVVGLVNRTRDRRILRWQQPQRQPSSRVGAGKHQEWIVQSAMKAVSVSESQFETEVLQSSVPVLVDFWATWCGPCRLMGISLDWAAQHYDGKVKCVKIETDGNESLVDKYAVYGLPTLILFVNGEIVPSSHREGALNKERLQAYLEANLPTLAATA